MRVVSQYAAYDGPVARPEITEVIAGPNGPVTRLVQKTLIARPWRAGFLSDYEFQKAIEQWPNPRGMTDGTVLRARFSVFDSFWAQQEHGWTDDEREQVEQGLRVGPGNGNDYIVVEFEKALAPYPKYDVHRRVHGRRTLDHALTDIQSAYESTGFDIGQAVAYERENLDDARVVAALEALAGAPVADEELIEA